MLCGSALFFHHRDNHVPRVFFFLSIDRGLDDWMESSTQKGYLMNPSRADIKTDEISFCENNAY